MCQCLAPADPNSVVLHSALSLFWSLQSKSSHCRTHGRCSLNLHLNCNHEEHSPQCPLFQSRLKSLCPQSRLKSLCPGSSTENAAQKETPSCDEPLQRNPSTPPNQTSLRRIPLSLETSSPRTSQPSPYCTTKFPLILLLCGTYIVCLWTPQHGPKPAKIEGNSTPGLVKHGALASKVDPGRLWCLVVGICVELLLGRAGTTIEPETCEVMSDGMRCEA